MSTTLLISIIVHSGRVIHSTTRLQLISQWFPLEVIHTLVHPTSPINLVFIQCSTPLGSQSEISEIESSSLFNRAVRLVMQYTQSEIECHSKPLPFLSFLLFPIWNDEMNGNSDRETSDNKRDYSSTIRMKWVACFCYSSTVLYLQPFRYRFHLKRIRLISESGVLWLWNYA